MYQDRYTLFSQIPGIGTIHTDEPMSRHTTFRIGGPADLFLMPETKEALLEALRRCRKEKLPCFLLGNGSNLLVSDLGFRGVILQLYKNYGEVTFTPEGRITAQAGAMLAGIARKAAAASLTGLEFASGIPGTLGGAVVMNAGAYGGQMADVVTSVELMTAEGELCRLSADQMGFGYRTSLAQQQGAVVLEAVMELVPGEKTKIDGRMEELRLARTAKQPLDLPSAGSTFKRPEGYFAGKLIMDAGLRGFRVGDAMVSEKHCGFVVNAGAATAGDVRSLMKQVQSQVFDQFGVMLEPEVKLLGFEDAEA